MKLLLSRLGTVVALWLHVFATTFVALILSLSNWMWWPAALPLIAFGLFIDFNRSSLAERLGEHIAKRGKQACLPFRIYVSPRHIIYGVAIVWLIQSVGYYTLDDECWPHLNSWIETNIRILRWRFSNYPQLCSMPRGSFLAALQYFMPLFVLVFTAMMLTSSHFEPGRFIEESWRRKGSDSSLLLHRENAAKRVALGFVVIIYVYTISAFLPFSIDGRHCARCLVPHRDYVAFFIWQLSCFLLILISHIYTTATVTVGIQSENFGSKC